MSWGPASPDKQMKIDLLWVFDEFVFRELLGTPDAAMRFERVVDAGAHLPGERVQSRLRKWRGS